MLDLPPEILGSILRQALSVSWSIPNASWSSPAFPQPFALDRTQAVILMEVCRAWYRVACELLYESVFVDHIDQLPRLVHALETWPELAKLLRNLTISCYIPDLDDWEKVHQTGITRLLELCGGNITRLGLSIAPDPSSLLMAPLATGSAVCHLDLRALSGSEMPDVYPILAGLAPQLVTLSTYVPEAVFPSRIVFPRVTDLRLVLHAVSASADHAWEFLVLQSLVIDIGDRYTARQRSTEPVRDLIRTLGGKTITHLSVPPLSNWTWYHPVSSEYLEADHAAAQEMLDACPELLYLKIGIAQCLAEQPFDDLYLPPLTHRYIAALDIVGRANWHPGDMENVYLDYLRGCREEGMPALRNCRFIDAGLSFLGTALLPDPLEGEGELWEYDAWFSGGDDVDYRQAAVPQGSWLAFVLGDDDMWDDKDCDEDPDYEPGSSESESDGEDESSGDSGQSEEEEDTWEIDSAELSSLLGERLESDSDVD
ncbi:hypothetical protein MIND_01267200 [Mycena indigotica]|uniref:F-box domain-containing protein n=1 Tax=Mycena indigotica TaxID=2126181 RepID=A0A8H6S4N0_9AGAR|nr:uncharacterized protein MIND_01267200 [Mycena indigotica]KAF7291235.1 hypothetical protein MIND_01267200 [Mycena indigotica]